MKQTKTMKKPLVSICCITYNQELYLRDALDGFIMQKTDFPFEIVISDDCSSDGTREIIADYKKNYPNLIVDVSPEKNRGVIENWKYVHIQAKGELIAFCEGDDYWTNPLKLQKQVEYMLSNPDCGLCITDFRYQNDLDKKHISEPAFASGSTFKPTSFIEHLKNAGYIGPMTWMYRRELFVNNIKDYVGITDGTLALALDMFWGAEVAYIPEVTAVYRIHSGSAANQVNTKKHMQYAKGACNTQYYYAKKYKCNPEIINELKMQNYTTSMLLAIDSGDQEFVQEALLYYKDKGLYMKWFVESCKEYVNYKHQYEQIRSSKAYRLGKVLLKPFKWFKRK